MSHFGAVVAIAIFCIISDGFVYSIRVALPTDWIETGYIGIFETGQWNRIHTCPPGSFVTGYAMVLNDVAEVNSVYLKCAQLNSDNKLETSKIIKTGINYQELNDLRMLDPQNGRLNAFSDYAIGFAVHHWTESDGQRYIGEREIIFSGEDESKGVGSFKNSFNVVRDEVRCEDSWGICGVQAKISRDGTITKLRFKCCYYCIPEEIVVVLRDYTNSGSTEISHQIKRSLGSQVGRGSQAGGARDFSNNFGQDSSSGREFQINQGQNQGIHHLSTLSNTIGSNYGTNILATSSEGESLNFNTNQNSMHSISAAQNMARNQGQAFGIQNGQSLVNGGSNTSSLSSGDSSVNGGSENLGINSGTSFSYTKGNSHAETAGRGEGQSYSTAKGHSSGRSYNQNTDMTVDEGNQVGEGETNDHSLGYQSGGSKAWSTGRGKIQTLNQNVGRNANQGFSQHSSSNLATSEGIIEGGSSTIGKSSHRDSNYGHSSGSTQNRNTHLSFDDTSGTNFNVNQGHRNSQTQGSSVTDANSLGSSNSGSNTRGQTRGTSARESKGTNWGAQGSIGLPIKFIGLNLGGNYGENTNEETGSHSDHSIQDTDGWENNSRKEHSNTKSTGLENSVHRDISSGGHDSSSKRTGFDKGTGTHETGTYGKSSGSSTNAQESTDFRQNQDITRGRQSGTDSRVGIEHSINQQEGEERRVNTDSSESIQASKDRRFNTGNSRNTLASSNFRETNGVSKTIHKNQNTNQEMGSSRNTQLTNEERTHDEENDRRHKTKDYQINQNYQTSQQNNNELRYNSDFQRSNQWGQDKKYNSDQSFGKSFNEEQSYQLGGGRGFNRQREKGYQSGYQDNFQTGETSGWERRSQFEMQLAIQRSAQAMFAVKYGTSSSNGFNWGTSSSSMWTQDEEEVDSFACEPMHRCVLKQLIGKCGIVQINTPKLIKIVERIDNTTATNLEQPLNDQAKNIDDALEINYPGQTWITAKNFTTYYKPSGIWESPQICPPNSIVVGHRFKVLRNQGTTGMELQCSGSGNAELKLTSGIGKSGEWIANKIEPKNYAIGFSFLEVFTNGAIRIGNQEIRYQDVAPLPRPAWASAARLHETLCPIHQAVCGIQTMMDKDGHGFLTAIGLKCCTHCNYEEKMETLSSFENRGTTPTTHVIRMTVGKQTTDTATNETSNGDNLSTNSAGINPFGLQAGFAAQFGNTSSHGFDWSQTSTSLWTDNKETQITYECQGGHLCTYKQLVGICGDIRIPTQHTIEESLPIEVEKPKYVGFDLVYGRELWVTVEGLQLNEPSGIWESAESCPLGTVATNHRLKMTEKSEELTGISFACSYQTTGGEWVNTNTEISSKVGPTGNWTNKKSNIDDVANRILFRQYFQNNELNLGQISINYENDETSNFDLKNSTLLGSSCPTGFGICGIQTMMDEAGKGIVTNARIRCCYHCQPKEKRVILDAIKNTGSIQTQRRVSGVAVGNNFDDSEKIDVLDRVWSHPKLFQTLFSNAFANSSTSQFDWTATPRSLWTSVEKRHFEYVCEANHFCKLEQVVGVCDDNEIPTPYTVIESRSLG